MRALDALGHALGLAGSMTWQITWSLILGFTLSAIVQAVVRRQTVVRLLGDDRPRSLVLATGLGAASSSCSYGAVALARSLVRRGASFTAAMAFEIASTNLVIELGIIMALLIAWQFTLAEFVGGPIMIVLVSVAFRLFVRQRLIKVAREQADEGLAGSMEGHAAMDMSIQGSGSFWRRLLSRDAYPAGTLADVLTGLPPVAGIAWAQNGLVVSTRTSELWQLTPDGKYQIIAGVATQPPTHGGTDNMAASEAGDLVTRLVGHGDVLVLDAASEYKKSRWIRKSDAGTVMAMTWDVSDIILGMDTGVLVRVHWRAPATELSPARSAGVADSTRQLRGFNQRPWQRFRCRRHLVSAAGALQPWACQGARDSGEGGISRPPGKCWSAPEVTAAVLDQRSIHNITVNTIPKFVPSAL